MKSISRIPSPALGWENGEEAPFLERVAGRFDMVFALALIHHLLVRERVPLAYVAAHFARQTTRWAVLEWVPPSDPQFRRLAGPYWGLYEACGQEAFEAALAPHFRVLRQCLLPGNERLLYLLEAL